MTVRPGETVRAFAPATVANVGPGFDVLGLALDGPGDTVTAISCREAGVRIRAVRDRDGKPADLPLDVERNTASVAAIHTLARAGIENIGIELELDKGLPIGSGLGSSAASAAAAAYAVNVLIGAPLRKVQLVDPCVDAEGAVAGRHADNVAPALLGGLVLVRSVDPLDIVRLPVPAGLFVATVTPDLQLATKAARDALPSDVPIRGYVQNSANLAALVSACYSGDLGLLARSLEDQVVAPVRCASIPGGSEALAAARSAGALGASVSGAGPTLFAMCHSQEGAVRVCAAMQSALQGVGGLDATVAISPADCPGVRRV